jgi:hypothetical protein
VVLGADLPTGVKRFRQPVRRQVSVSMSISGTTPHRARIAVFSWRRFRGSGAASSDAGLSAWELGDPLGIQPHLLRGPHPLLTSQPVQVLIESAFRLDIHPADLVPELEPLLSHRPQARRDADSDQYGRADALTVLTALATARAPLSADQLARALSWQLPRTTVAIAAAQDNPDLGGPLALRRIPPETWTVTPRLDVLTQAQHRALRDTAGAPILDDDQARVLLAALAVGQKWQGGNYPGLRTRPGWAATEAALKENRPDLQPQRPGRSPCQRRRQIQPPLQRRRSHRPRTRRALTVGPGRNTSGPGRRAALEARE